MRALLGRFLRPPPIDPRTWDDVRARAAWVRRLGDGDDAALAGLAARFLAEKTITPLGGLVLDDRDRALLAALCCLPLVRFGAGGLRGWSQLLVYPQAFRVERTHVDAAGVLHRWDDELIGESWEAGPLVLSWADVQSDLDEPAAGFCVAVHEMAHKLDALDGVLDGTPPLPKAWQRTWARDFQAAYDAFADNVDRGRETAIDPYAAEAPEEFFAVCSEYHFSDPALLEREFPAVAGHLRRLYGGAD
ncbi:zinc-dependent peptidase [Luteimonas pelagia]